ncbi:P-loop containing nucleoside triphosphate hydrolase protein [Gautieria morchelliformis]|nr:P-loop containing nucleoside triphosphate hydrolase protein [Gautieria morchelliformis]
MSKIPRVASSPDRLPTAPCHPLKRKAIDDDNPIPAKLPALASGVSTTRILKTSTKSHVNGVRPASAAGTRGPPPLTKPRPPTLSGSTNGAPQRSSRAVSAPPSKRMTGTTGARGASSGRAGRVAVTGGARLGTVDDERYTEIQNQMTQMESARASDLAKVTSDMEAERAKVQELQAFHSQLSRQLADYKTLEIEQRRSLMNASDELDSLKKKHAREVMDLEMDRTKLQREVRELKEEIRVGVEDLVRERESLCILKTTISQQSTSQLSLQTQITALQATNTSLHASLAAATSQTGDLNLQLEQANTRIFELEREVREAETVRRKLHNTIQELKGNIRVFCRVRPPLPSDIASGDGDQDAAAIVANIDYPDKRDRREIVLSSSGESATGAERREVWNFSFDRVFEPISTQAEVFEEISQLAQSCVDGYHVCIFAYGQTGSGKSFTMEGGSTQQTAGMIPRAVDQVFSATEGLKSKGWQYKLEGQFLEIYNETINDLLGNGELDKKKHEIRHDKGSTRVTDVVIVPLESPSQVRSLLLRAQSRRTVAATLMNERSSRSHSVFTLRICGSNPLTQETSEGSLNLVDLAGSERLNSSGAGNDKDRLKETQNINRSLSALGDVIAALGNAPPGQGDKHIPYRNSKLTYLLQTSLSGNSKTLMVLNLSPLATHLSESLCSLRFATKVNNTTLGTAKKQTRVSP